MPLPRRLVHTKTWALDRELWKRFDDHRNELLAQFESSIWDEGQAATSIRRGPVSKLARVRVGILRLSRGWGSHHSAEDTETLQGMLQDSAARCE